MASVAVAMAKRPNPIAFIISEYADAHVKKIRYIVMIPSSVTLRFGSQSLNMRILIMGFLFDPS